MDKISFKFNGTPGSYFLVFIIVLITSYIPILGWPIAFNYMSGWIVDNTEVSGRKLKYSAGYGETLLFILVNTLLIMVTLGIYMFWFAPKSYRYIMDHTSELASAPAPVAQPTMQAPANEPVINELIPTDAPAEENSPPQDDAPRPPLVQ